MQKLTKEVEAILLERFGKDNVIALGTTVDNIPYVRYVNGFYDHGSFYILTHALSGKMKQIAQNPIVAIAGEWFNAQGNAVDLGYFGNEENSLIASKMKTIFAEWIDNGHNDFDDKNTIILCVHLTQGVLFSHGNKYEIDFSA